MTVWRTESNLWEFASSTPAVADTSGRGDIVIGAVTRSGAFACIETGTGRTRWTLDLGTAPNGTSVVAADIDGDGRDEFVVGLPDGRLLCIGERADGQGRIRWSVAFDAAVANPIVVDLDGDGIAELVIATADGQVRWLA
jgi:outer membrane protein assembly factor BamB